MKKIFLVALLAAIAAATGIHLYLSDRGRWTTDPEFTELARSVSGNSLTSVADPGVILRFAPEYRYIGGQKFVLYGVADAEQHFFVETTKEDELKSFYWIQFEAYLPDNSYRYDYEDSPGQLRLGDYAFYVDTAVVEANPEKRRRGTDGAMARQFAQSKGYSLPDDYLYARLVHLTDASRRKEMMVIFIENLAPMDLTAAELSEGGDQSARRPELERQMQEKIRRTMTLETP